MAFPDRDHKVDCKLMIEEQFEAYFVQKLSRMLLKYSHLILPVLRIARPKTWLYTRNTVPFCGVPNAGFLHKSRAQI